MSLNVPLINETEHTLVRRSGEEIQRLGDLEIPISLNIPTALLLAANLKLALSHPHNNGESAKIAREILAGIVSVLKQEGYSYTADLANLGQPSANITQF